MVLQDLLRREQFQYLRVLNSHANLSRTVLTVESTETPDVAKYIPPNTLLVMTGMVFKDAPEQLCAFLENLNAGACAAVAIKLGRFIDVLDDRVIAKADELGLPLLQIPMDKTLGQVYQEILSYIWNNQNDAMLRALNAQQKISNLILQGSSVKSILQNVALILDRPVMILDLFGQVVEHSYLYIRADRERTVAQMQQLMETNQLDDMPYLMCQEENLRFCVYHIKGVSRNTHYMVVWDYDPRVTEEHVLVLEQIIMALELYFYRDLYVKYSEIQRTEKSLDFFLEQLESKCWDERQVLTLGEFYGLRRTTEYRFVLLEISHPVQQKFNSVNFSKREERFILIYDWIRRMFCKDSRYLLFPQQSKWRCVCLVQGEQSGYLDQFREIYHMVRKKFGQEILIAQGGIVSSPVNLRNSYVEAEQCLVDGNVDRDEPFLLSYRPQNMMELFKFVPEREMKGICECTLKELAYPHNQMEEELRKTLYTYLFCNSSITKTAENMFLHRNTIKYRIKKCEEILNMDLSDMTSCFQIQLALMLTEYAQ